MTDFSKTPIDIVREYFPDITDADATYILWDETGFPSFWAGDPETCLRGQLQAFKDKYPTGIDRYFALWNMPSWNENVDLENLRRDRFDLDAEYGDSD